jgi:YD repeat-containing protein
MSLSASLSASTGTQYTYDARGRLVEVSDNNKTVYYVLDAAGNRTSVSNTPPTTAPALDPVINSFIAPDTVSRPGNVTVSWNSSHASYCAFAIFGDSSNYSNLPVVGSLSFYLFENTGVQIACFEGSKSAAMGKIIRISSGGTGPGGPLN